MAAGPSVQPQTDDEEVAMNIFFGYSPAFVSGAAAGRRDYSGEAMPFAPELESATFAEDFASAHFVVVGMLYNSKKENGENEGVTEAGLLHVIKNHPSLKNKKHLTLNRYVPTKRDGECYVLFGEVFKGEVDIYRGIRCSGRRMS